MSEMPQIAGRASLAVEVEAGQSYWWCACGRSNTQPFCDGSHQGTSFSPIEYVPEESGQAFFCACKRSGKKPLCDGTHKKLPPP